MAWPDNPLSRFKAANPNVSLTKVGVTIGLKQPKTVYRYLRGERIPAYKFRMRLQRYFGIDSRSWARA